ncbi:MAG TPA: hypothetical protein VJN96_25410 [Vicinamibacterales bacterium]|nr:hypothetical protein [Vicinamibacterales bacterium]
MKLLGIVLIVLGVVGVLYGGFTWTTKDKVVDLGPLEVSTEKTHSLPLPPIAGALSLIAGTALVVMSGRKSA